MNNIKIFKNTEFGSVRTVMIDDEPYFVGRDVADVLGYSNPQKALRDHIDEEDKTLNESFTVNGTKGILINESGLYSLILSSKLPKAKLEKDGTPKFCVCGLGYFVEEEYCIDKNRCYDCWRTPLEEGRSHNDI